jgi:hypothetical protein
MELNKMESCKLLPYFKFGAWDFGFPSICPGRETVNGTKFILCSLNAIAWLSNSFKFGKNPLMTTEDLTK